MHSTTPKRAWSDFNRLSRKLRRVIPRGVQFVHDICVTARDWTNVRFVTTRCPLSTQRIEKPMGTAVTTSLTRRPQADEVNDRFPVLVRFAIA